MGQSRVVVVILACTIAVGCASSGRAFKQGNSAARSGEWDTAVEYYRRALQAKPASAEYRVALQRAMVNASRDHLDRARVLEARNQVEDALREFRLASEFDPSNRQVAGKVLELERAMRTQAEVGPARTNIALLRDRARQASLPVLVAANEPVPGLRFQNSSMRDVLNFLGMAMGINVTFEQTYQDRPVTVQLDGVTLEQALNQLLSSQQLFYKVVNERTIMVIPDNAQKRAQYEEQVIRTFFLSNADSTELAQLINTVIRVPAMAVQPQVAANKTANTITIRATTSVAAIIERIIEANDNPRAEVVIDVEVLEINRTRAKNFGLNLSDYSLTGVFSPEADPRGTAGNAATFAPSPFNLNTITRGISTADFYLAVPSAVVRFLESDSETKLMAKPQLRGSEGQKITLNLGDEIPVPATVFTPIAQGGTNTNPLTSFNYKTVGIIVEMTPTVTPEGDIVLDMLVENSTRGQDVNIAGQNLPSFGTRRVNTRLRLRDGESNLLAGLLREQDRKTLRGVPGLLRLPILSKLLASNDTSIDQTDIVMLLTPRIVRTRDLTQSDLSPIFIGTQQNIGLGGPPPLIASPDAPATSAAPPVTAAPPSPAAAVPPPAAAPVVPGATPPPPTVALPPVTVGPAAGPSPGPAPPVTVPPPTPQTPPVQPSTSATPPVGGGPSSAPVATPSIASGPVQAGVPALSTVPDAPRGVAPVVPTVRPGGATVVLTPPGSEFRVGGGPYTVAISATDTSRLSSATLTLTFNPAVLRVRTVQEGSFMRAGGATATFTQSVDAASGRIDIAIVRPNDATGVAGTGLLSAVLFDAVGAGPANLTITGTGSEPGGRGLSLQFSPAPLVQVR